MSREEPACLDPDDPIGVFPGPSDGERHHAPERWRETVSAEAVTHLRRVAGRAIARPGEDTDGVVGVHARRLARHAP